MLKISYHLLPLLCFWHIRATVEKTDCSVLFKRVYITLLVLHLMIITLHMNLPYLFHIYRGYKQAVGITLGYVGRLTTFLKYSHSTRIKFVLTASKKLFGERNITFPEPVIWQRKTWMWNAVSYIASTLMTWLCVIQS